jgi:hypothetical protein
MKSRTAFILRRALLAVAIVPVAWLIAFASGIGALVAREELHVGNAQGSTVTCRYIHAAGTYEMLDFTENPDAVVCALFVSVRSPPVSGDHWAAPLPPDKAVQIECRFIRYPADGDNGLGTRFVADAPLRLKVNFAARQLTVIGEDDRSALGEPVFDPTLSADTRANAWGALVYFPHGAVPILAGDPPGRLTLVIFSDNGHAALMLLPPRGALLWTRDGGCRISA